MSNAAIPGAPGGGAQITIQKDSLGEEVRRLFQEFITG